MHYKATSSRLTIQYPTLSDLCPASVEQHAVTTAFLSAYMTVMLAYRHACLLSVFPPQSTLLAP